MKEIIIFIYICIQSKLELHAALFTFYFNLKLLLLNLIFDDTNKINYHNKKYIFMIYCTILCVFIINNVYKFF